MNFEKGKFYYVRGEDMEFLGERDFLGGRVYQFQGIDDRIQHLRFGVDFDQEDMNSMRPIPENRKDKVLEYRESFNKSKAHWVDLYGAD